MNVINYLKVQQVLVIKGTGCYRQEPSFSIAKSARLLQNLRKIARNYGYVHLECLSVVARVPGNN